MSQALDCLNWNKFRELAHSLKGSSGYVGAGQLQYDCFYIQDYHYKGQIDQMRSRYSRLMEDTIEFLVYSKQYLELQKEKEPSLSKNIAIQEIDYLGIPIAKGYKIQKNGNIHICVAVSEGQTPEQRLVQRQFEVIKPNQDEFSSAQINLGGTVSNFNQNYINSQIGSAEPPGPRQGSQGEEEQKLNGNTQELPIIEENEALSSQRSMVKNIQKGNQSQVLSNRSKDGNGSIGSQFLGSNSQYEVVSPGGTVKKKQKKQLKFGKSKQIKGMTQEQLQSRQRAKIQQQNSNYQSQNADGAQAESEEEKIPPPPVLKERIKSKPQIQDPEPKQISEPIKEPDQIVQQPIVPESTKTPKKITSQLIIHNTDQSQSFVQEKLNQSMKSIKSNLSHISIQKSNFSQHGILKPGQGAGSSRAQSRSSNQQLPFTVSGQKQEFISNKFRINTNQSIEVNQAQQMKQLHSLHSVEYAESQTVQKSSCFGNICQQSQPGDNCAPNQSGNCNIF